MGNSKLYYWTGTPKSAADETEIRNNFAAMEVHVTTDKEGREYGYVDSMSMGADAGVTFLIARLSAFTLVRVDLDWTDVVVAEWHEGGLKWEQRYRPEARPFWGTKREEG